METFEAFVEARRQADLGPPGQAEIAAILRDAVLRGVLRPGERVKQDQVASRLGVSHVPVREAFQKLVSEGLLVFRPRRGVVVAPLSPDEAAELTDLRLLLEPEALRLSGPRLTASEIAGAFALLTELEETEDVERLMTLHARFHDALYARAGRPRLTAYVADLRRAFERYLHAVWIRTGQLDRSHGDHRRLAVLIADGKVNEATALLREHIRRTGRHVAACLADTADVGDDGRLCRTEHEKRK